MTSTHPQWEEHDFDFFIKNGFRLFDDNKSKFFFCPWTPTKGLVLITSPDGKILKTVNWFQYHSVHKELDEKIQHVARLKAKVERMNTALQEELGRRKVAETKIGALNAELNKTQGRADHWYQLFMKDKRQRAHDEWARGGWAELERKTA